MASPAKGSVQEEDDQAPRSASAGRERPAASPLRDPVPAARPWGADPEQIWHAARILAAAILVVWLIAWPIGTTLANRETTGLWNFGFGYSGAVVILALTNAGLVLAGGYLLRAALRLEATADRLGEAVRGFEPGFQSEGMRQDVAALGGEVDRALERLATAERQIRQQVGLIDAATEAMRQNADRTTERVAKERQALIDATAAMNAEAEAFAGALGARGGGVSADFEKQLERLESVSRNSAEQFASLREAMAEQTSLLRQAPEQLSGQFQRGADDLQRAQQALMDESEKLRLLIEQQRDRADSLGKSLAEQSERLSTRRETVNKNIGGSWRRILDRVEKSAAEATESLIPAADQSGPAGSSPEEGRIARLQDLTVRIKTELFGEPTRGERERFEAGERQLFTQQILGRDHIELRARLRAAIERDDGFADLAERFLSDFDQLLAPMMNADPEGSEAALQEMLRAPLGQLYVLIGTARGHFS